MKLGQSMRLAAAATLPQSIHLHFIVLYVNLSEVLVSKTPPVQRMSMNATKIAVKDTASSFRLFALFVILLLFVYILVFVRLTIKPLCFSKFSDDP